MREISLRTHSRSELLDITAKVADAVRESQLEQGWVTAFVTHTTAGITINENADPDVGTDLLATLDKIVPRRGAYRHTEGNADSHVKASLMGSSVTVPVQGGGLLLGTWQGIFFCEFDGPRTRHVVIEVVGERAAR
ncbi:MAG: YjbQ family protein [Armatimonadetes bacterium]|nr:YjbQ family protein [Armatimonadota bacterium]NIM24287.1 YjbQ family protein [Armatimonadota bacterium]NIM68156.1 YjbQ family protein [Armatimonadota bacterium]NIM76616.1 YjbQ family protein [Armatimonadota bacterium]NIN06361.1 YjbQ family protein [Armatimonadota bacterium]